MSLNELAPMLIFVAITGLALVLLSRTSDSEDRVALRLRQFSEGKASDLGPNTVRRQTSEVIPRPPAPQAPAVAEDPGRDKLRQRLFHAGYYQPQALARFLAVKRIVLFAPWMFGSILVLSHAVSLTNGAIGVGMLSGLGLLLPGFWLDSRKQCRQGEFRKALPDLFDLLVLCLEGGMGMEAAARRITVELKRASPLLWSELKFVEQEVELGRPLGEALRHFAARTDLDEIASLASVIAQSERLGTALAKPLRVLADTLRMRRVQRAEEMAHKAATKIVFPTLLFIFPGVFAIILGPMAIQVMELFSGAKK